MASYLEMNKQELKIAYTLADEAYNKCLNEHLKLDMSRGKPGKEQLEIVSGLFSVLQTGADCVDDGIDARNYGELAGLPCARRYWAEILGCRENEVFVGGNSSLNLMYDVISKAYTHGLIHSPRPWGREETVKFLCPCPGYDRHFRITESFGAELVPVAMTPDGPDMHQVEELIQDPAVKGIWCVPKYSNPDGIIYSDETVRRFSQLRPAAPDFTIMWDNAYCVHEFDGDFIEFPDIISMCAEAGNEDMVFEFASTSKVTLPGSGISALAASEENIRYMSKLLGVQIISYDKVNQLRHVRFLKDKKHTLELMRQHAQVLRPKFAMVSDTLEQEIAPLEIASWNRPKGGYFVSLNAYPGTAKRTLELCAQAGVVMTPAGATFPYGEDPKDSNIRIAPTLPSVEELEKAMRVLCVSLRLAALEKLLND
jgi:DNA-binding transcriptional MocR family regulator